MNDSVIKVFKGFTVTERIGIYITCDEALSLFKGAETAPRFGGGGLHMFLLGQELSKVPHFDVNFVFYEREELSCIQAGNVTILSQKLPIKNGLPLVSRWLNRRRVTSLYKNASKKRVLINTMAGYSERLVYEASLVGAKSIFAVASDTDVDKPHGFDESSASRMLQAIKKADLVVAQTESQSETLMKNCSKQSIVIRKGMPAPSKIIQQENKHGLLWVASAQPLKQPWIFIDLARALPDYDFVMVMPPAEPMLMEYIQRQAKELPNLVLVDCQVPYPEIQDYFNEAAVFVYTSEFNSHPDLTVIQAFLGGCAVVSERLDPEKGMFSKDGCGLLAHADFTKLVEQTEQLMSDIERRRKYAAVGFEYAKVNYSLEAMGLQYKEAIEKLFL